MLTVHAAHIVTGPAADQRESSPVVVVMTHETEHSVAQVVSVLFLPARAGIGEGLDVLADHGWQPVDTDQAATLEPGYWVLDVEPDQLDAVTAPGPVAARASARRQDREFGDLLAASSLGCPNTPRCGRLLSEHQTDGWDSGANPINPRCPDATSTGSLAGAGAECRAATFEGHGCLGRVLDGQCTEQDDHHPTPGMVPCCGPGEHDEPTAVPARGGAR